MKKTLLISFLTFYFATGFAQTDTLNYKFLDWYATTLGQKRIYIDKYPHNISKFDLGTQKEYFQRTDPNTRICGNPIVYSQRIITAFDELKINYDTVSLDRQIMNSYSYFLTQDKFKNGKIVSYRHFYFLGRIISPFRHQRTITLSMPLLTDSNKYLIVKSSVLDRRSRKKQSSIDIFQIQADSSFKLIKRLNRQYSILERR